MATRTLLFFMRPAEFWDGLWSAADENGLTVIVERYGRDRTVEIAAQSGATATKNGGPVDEVYLAEGVLPEGTLRPGNLKPAAWGWVSCNVPREVGDVLLMTQLSAKSHWWDEQARTMLENAASLQIFSKVARAFRHQLTYPLWGRNIVLGGGGRPYRNVGYSKGVTEWVEQGGELSSVGATWDRPSHIRFFIKPEEQD